MTSQPARISNSRRYGYLAAATVVSVAVIIVLAIVATNSYLRTSTHSQVESISVSGVSLCRSNCTYPAPHVSASILVNGGSPLSTLTVYVNETYDGVAFENPSTATIGSCYGSSNGAGSGSTTSSCTTRYTQSNTLTNFVYLYKGSVPGNLIPIIVGDTYVFKFVATFQDGSTSTAVANIIAD